MGHQQTAVKQVEQQQRYRQLGSAVAVAAVVLAAVMTV
jgi:hypothetical protein